MKSFVFACLAIIAIGVSASQITARLGPSAADRSASDSVRLD